MSPSRLFILRPVATTLLMLGLTLVGAGGVPRASCFRVAGSGLSDHSGGDVLSGREPAVMASSVTAPLERQFGQVPGLSQMTSTSSLGSSIITLQFNLDQNIDIAEQQVQAAINAAATYPAARSAESADLQQGQSGRLADPDSGADFRNAAAFQSSRMLPTRTGAENFSGYRASDWFRSAAGRSLPCVFRPTQPRWLPTALSLEDVRTALGHGQCGSGKGHAGWPATVVHDWRQRSACWQQAIQTDHHRLPQRRSGAAVRYRNRLSIALKTQAGRMDEYRLPAVIVNIQRQPGANIISVVDRMKKLLPMLQVVACRLR